MLGFGGSLPDQEDDEARGQHGGGHGHAHGEQELPQLLRVLGTLLRREHRQRVASHLCQREFSERDGEKEHEETPSRELNVTRGPLCKGASEGRAHTHTAMKKLRIVIPRFGTARQKMVLE